MWKNMSEEQRKRLLRVVVPTMPDAPNKAMIDGKVDRDLTGTHTHTHTLF
jgi:hypothetical protein